MKHAALIVARRANRLGGRAESLVGGEVRLR